MASLGWVRHMQGVSNDTARVSAIQASIGSTPSHNAAMKPGRPTPLVSKPVPFPPMPFARICLCTSLCILADDGTLLCHGDRTPPSNALSPSTTMLGDRAQLCATPPSHPSKFCPAHRRHLLVPSNVFEPSPSAAHIVPCGATVPLLRHTPQLTPSVGCILTHTSPPPAPLRSTVAVAALRNSAARRCTQPHRRDPRAPSHPRHLAPNHTHWPANDSSERAH
ncbi:hypothetical protein B0H10DRAFT_2228766 [Mycena sp. CBHHK59/15]|nr:hypothetical protein B0H10DRAFT_2228766 [Mycena sp. CBHHK59/15]